MSNQSIQEVANCVNQLNNALVSRDARTLTGLSSAGLSYGHSKGKVENREQFVNNVAGENATQFVSIEIENQTIEIVGVNAVVRHTFKAVTSKKGVTGNLQIQNLLVWQNNDGKWELIARQAFAF
jgi:hypothetical protein